MGGGQRRDGAHLALRLCREAAVESTALPACVPNGEGRPVWQSPFFQEVDTVGPDGGPMEGRLSTWPQP